MMPGVRVRRLASNPDLSLPSRQTPGSAGYDVSSAEPDFVLGPLDHNDLFHVIQLGAMLLLFQGARRIGPAPA